MDPVPERERAPTILLTAGEPSGDMHGAAVARELKRRWPNVRLFGLGGPRMAAEGVDLLAGLDRLAVMGFAEVARHLPFFLRLLRDIRGEMTRRGTDLVIPVDYPGFNLRLSRSAKEAGIPVLFFIAPQVWAWHRSRTRQLAERTDRLAVILPFEVPFFTGAGAHAEFVGHPLLEVNEPVPDRASFCTSLGLDAERPILALFPGSRRQEVERHLALFGAAAQRLVSEHPRLQPVIAASRSVPSDLFTGASAALTHDGRALLHHARAAIVKSGTTTLEAALAGTPMVVAYRTSPLTYFLARRLVEVDHIGLVNLVAGERLVPELVQDAATPDALAAALMPLVEETPERARVLRGLAAVRESLQPRHGGSAAGRVADLAAELLQR